MNRNVAYLLAAKSVKLAPERRLIENKPIQA